MCRLGCATSPRWCSAPSQRTGARWSLPGLLGGLTWLSSRRRSSRPVPAHAHYGQGGWGRRVACILLGAAGSFQLHPACHASPAVWRARHSVGRDRSGRRCGSGLERAHLRNPCGARRARRCVGRDQALVAGPPGTHPCNHTRPRLRLRRTLHARQAVSPWAWRSTRARRGEETGRCCWPQSRKTARRCADSAPRPTAPPATATAPARAGLTTHESAAA